MPKRKPRWKKPSSQLVGNLQKSQVEMVRTIRLMPAVINDRIYKPVQHDDPSIRELATSIAKYGVLEPLLITQDDVIVSGHRRYAAAQVAGLKEVPAQVVDIESNHPDFQRLLVEANRQRDKTSEERIREELVLTSPELAYGRLHKRHVEKTATKVRFLQPDQRAPRSKFSEGKLPFLEAVKRCIEELKDSLPISVRRIHYMLLNNPPMTANTKRSYRYANDDRSYDNLSDLLTRARIFGLIPFDAVVDETRPQFNWTVYGNVGSYVRQSLDDYLAHYRRDLTIGQHCHIELHGEKLTVLDTIKPIAMKYRIPCSIGRGYNSTDAKFEMTDRFRRSGKSRLVVLVVCDFDPEGEDMGNAMLNSLRDDFNVQDAQVLKVGLTYRQVQELSLPSTTLLKKKSSRAKKYIAKYGKYVWELEAVPVPTLRQWVDDGVRSVLDVDAFNNQIELEKVDAQKIEALRTATLEELRNRMAQFDSFLN
jgi:hypothetical protein